MAHPHSLDCDQKGLHPAVTNVTNAPHHGPGSAQDRGALPADRPGPRQSKLSGPAAAHAWRDLGPAGCGGWVALPPVSLAPICAVQPPEAQAPAKVATTCPQPPPCSVTANGDPGKLGGDSQHYLGVIGGSHRDKVPQNLQCGTSDFTATPVALLIHPSAGSYSQCLTSAGSVPPSTSPVTPVQHPGASTMDTLVPHQCPQDHTSVPSTGPQCQSAVLRATPVSPGPERRPQSHTSVPSTGPQCQCAVPRATEVSPVQDPSARSPSPGPHQCPQYRVRCMPPPSRH